MKIATLFSIVILFLLSSFGIALVTSEVGIAPVINSEQGRTKSKEKFSTYQHFAHENEIVNSNNTSFQILKIIKAALNNTMQNIAIFANIKSKLRNNQNVKLCQNNHAYIRKRSIRRDVNTWRGFKFNYV